MRRGVTEKMMLVRCTRRVRFSYKLLVKNLVESLVRNSYYKDTRQSYKTN